MQETWGQRAARSTVKDREGAPPVGGTLPGARRALARATNDGYLSGNRRALTAPSAILGYGSNVAEPALVGTGLADRQPPIFVQTTPRASRCTRLTPIT